MANSKILTLSLNKKWFNMIKSGQKREEYREIKPYRAVAEYMMSKIEKGHEAYEIIWTNMTTGKKIILTCKVIEPTTEADK